MHDTAKHAGRAFFDCYWHDTFESVLDVGSRSVNGSLRDDAPSGCRFVGIDISEGRGVDIVHPVPDDPMPFEPATFDAIISTSCFEHDRFFWLTFLNMIDVLKPHGYIYINAPSNGAYHSFPFDNWRFYPDAGLALSAWAGKSGRAGIHLIESLTLRSGDGGWNDFVMVFGGPEATAPDRLLADVFPNAFNIRRGQTDAVVVRTVEPEDKQLLDGAETRLASAIEELETLRNQLEDARRETRALRKKAKAAQRRADRKVARLRAFKALPSWKFAKALQKLRRKMKWPRRRHPASCSGNIRPLIPEYPAKLEGSMVMRSFQTAFTGPMLKSYQAGVLSYTYKGVRCLKSPIDIAIYMRLIWDMQPRTLIEIGSHSGGSALLFADLLGTFGCFDTPVISIDLKIPEGMEDSRIRFLEGSVLDLGPLFEAEGLTALPHPWFVTEDSAHSYDGCMAALGFFAEHMQTGDILAIEDGVLEDLGMGPKYEGGPNRAIADFLKAHPDSFDIATDLCDMFGQNATYNPNGYLRKKSTV